MNLFFLRMLTIVLLSTGLCFASGHAKAPPKPAPQEKPDDFTAIDAIISATQQEHAAKPNDIAIMIKLGKAYYERFKFEECIGVAQKIISQDANNAWGHIMLGNCLIGINKLDEAYSAYQKAAAINPGSALSLYSKGLIADEDESFGTSADFFEQAIKLDPTLEHAYYRLALAQLNLSDIPKALVALKKLHALNPDNKKATDLLMAVQSIKAAPKKEGGGHH